MILCCSGWWLRRCFWYEPHGSSSRWQPPFSTAFAWRSNSMPACCWWPTTHLSSTTAATVSTNHWLCIQHLQQHLGYKLDHVVSIPWCWCTFPCKILCRYLMCAQLVPVSSFCHTTDTIHCSWVTCNGVNILCLW